MVFLLGSRPGVFGLDRSPVIGFVQIAVFLIGLAMICIGNWFRANRRFFNWSCYDLHRRIYQSDVPLAE